MTVSTRIETDAASALDWADEVESSFRVLNEAGLFEGEAKSAETVLSGIAIGRYYARQSSPDRAAECLAHAELSLQQRMYQRSALWRGVNVHQLHIFLYHIVAVLIFLNIATGWLEHVALSVWPRVPVPMAMLVAGGLGASLRGIWYLWLQVSKHVYRAQFLLAHLAAPWIGMLFGLFVFLLTKASLLTLGGKTANPSGIAALPLALSFLAGYSWEWILARIDQVRRSTVDNPTPAAAPVKNGAVTEASTAPGPSHAATQVSNSDDEGAFGPDPFLMPREQ